MLNMPVMYMGFGLSVEEKGVWERKKV